MRFNSGFKGLIKQLKLKAPEKFHATEDSAGYREFVKWLHVTAHSEDR